MAKKGEGKRDSRNEIANNGRGEREGERDEGGRVTCMHRIGEGRRRREACLNRDGVESRVHCGIRGGSVQDGKGRPDRQ